METEKQNISITVGLDEGGKRLDRWLVTKYPDKSRSHLCNMIDRSEITVNGQRSKASYAVRPGDIVQLVLLAPGTQTAPQPEGPPLNIIFEDEHIIVLNKPAGLNVHAASTHKDQVTLLGSLQAHCGSLPWESEQDQERPGIVHRLDRGTSGVMVCAKTLLALTKLREQFKDRLCKKYYWALLDGSLPEPTVDHSSYLFRHPKERFRFKSISPEAYHTNKDRDPALEGAKLAHSVFTTKSQSLEKRFTLAEVQLLTGRTHQIRAHAKDLGCPVVGDPVYNGKRRRLPKGDVRQAEYQKIEELLKSITHQMLHAQKLVITHPSTGEELEFCAELPEDFTKIWHALQQCSLGND